MIKLHANGYHGVVRTDGRELCTSEVRRTLIGELYSRGLTLQQVAEVFGLHKSTVQRVVNRHDGERLEPLFGSGEWTPDVQDQDPRSCDRCGGDDGVIKRGSKLYCAACHRTGIERRLQDQRAVTEIAEQYVEVEAEYQAAASKKNLAQRRKIKRA
jgi:AraC-like DNA-binding protein